MEADLQSKAQPSTNGATSSKGKSLQAQNLLPITTCGGHTLRFEATEANTLSKLQSLLQDQLMMPEQAFELFDSDGCRLTTDGELFRAAFQQRVPLHAKPSQTGCQDAAQCNILRHQLSGLTESIDVLGRQMELLTSVFQAEKSEQAAVEGRLRADVTALMTNVKEQMSGAIQPLSDQLDIVSQLVDSERDFREATNVALEKQILDVRNAVEAEHVARQEDSAGAAQLIQEFHQIMQDGTSPPPEECHADSLVVCSEATTCNNPAASQT